MGQTQVNVEQRSVVTIGGPFSGIPAERQGQALNGIGITSHKDKLFTGAKGLLFKAAIWAMNHLLPFSQRFVIKAKVTFGMTNGVGIVRHDMFANMFGNGRELFGLSRIPGFAKNVGKKYLFKTYDARFVHQADFTFGDVIKLIIDVVEVGGTKFKVRGRFVNKRTGQVGVTMTQTIVYTNMEGKPTRFPLWLKVLLLLTCQQDYAKANGEVADRTAKRGAFFGKTIVTSDMVNAETNVSHDVYAKMLTQMIELFLLGLTDRRDCAFKVAEASYKYSRDFYFGDEIAINLKVIEVIGKEAVIFAAEFLDGAGKAHITGRQKIVFTDNKGAAISIPEKLLTEIKLV